MLIKEKVHNRDVHIEIIFSNKEILDSKKKFLYDTYKNLDLDKILKDITTNKLNTYVDVKVYESGKVIYGYQELYKTTSTVELIEVLLIIFEKKEWYEVCHVLTKYLNNIIF